MSFDERRRRLLEGGIAAGALVVGALQGLSMRAAHGAARPIVGPYGPLHAVKDRATGLPLLQLPEGFRYTSFSWAGDAMEDGRPVPERHDGMAALGVQGTGGDARIVLVRNHERAGGTIIDAPAVYDRTWYTGGVARVQPGGGTTTVLVPRTLEGAAITRASLGGTLANCAGGPTPWGTWLSCEETLIDLSTSGGRRHGYVFEVAPEAAQTTGQPIVGMGRFAHEAAAVDPASGIVYLTQDERNKSALYRYVPDDPRGRPGSLAAGGRLQAARVQGAPRASLNAPRQGDRHAIEWVEVRAPDAHPRALELPDARGPVAGPFAEAWAAGALRMARGEGCWHAGGTLFVVDTAAGRDALGRAGYGHGAVWTLDLATMQLTAIFVSPGALHGNHPDNVTVSPRGGVLLCEDGGGVRDAWGPGERLMGLGRDGAPYAFAKNDVVLSAQDVARAGKSVAPGDYRRNEFCGACFDPSGQILFVNIQTPGISFAIEGPWAKGPL